MRARCLECGRSDIELFEGVEDGMVKDYFVLGAHSSDLANVVLVNDVPHFYGGGCSGSGTKRWLPVPPMRSEHAPGCGYLTLYVGGCQCSVGRAESERLTGEQKG